MTSRHYDVVVLGRSLGALVTAALLSRRDFRVLLLGQGQRPCNYTYDRFSLCRRSFTLLAGSSPAYKRVLHELAQTPRFRRRTLALDPMFVVLSEGRRVEVPPDMELFAREVEREFPEVRQVVDELYNTFAQVNGLADTAFERDAIWPPGTFWERLETKRAAAELPFLGAEGHQDLLGKFPIGHPYRELVALPARFASHLDAPGESLPPFALARLHGAWTRGIQALSRGEDELSEFLRERIEAHGGECRLERRATSLLIQRGRVVGVLEDGEDEPTGAACVVSDQPGETLAALAQGQGISKWARKDWPKVSSSVGRFIVNLVVARAGIPDPLSNEAFVVPAERGPVDPRRPTLHLQKLDPQAGPGTESAEQLLVAEVLLPVRGPLTLLEAREAVLSTLREHLPFLERHLLVVDSPHDALPLYDFTSGTRREVERVHVPDTAASGESMQKLWSIEPRGFLDLAGEPVRGPIPGTYLVGSTVLPALGQEGELLAAWSAARLITRSDRNRQKMRRQMWSKIETT
ncbi:MAG TPA: phytoene dehydrogenase [Polyangiaceae bacterium]|nr:phytoene dehydrogenase [Polyangiaceae bacterium]